MHPHSTEVAVLHNYELVFDHPGIPLMEPAFANVKPKEGSKVYGVLYHMSKKEIEILNRMEGGGAYHNLELEVEGRISGKVIAHVYWSDNTGITHLKPSRRYLNLLIDGAKENNLPAEYIETLQKHEVCRHYPIISSSTSIIMPILNKVFVRFHIKAPFQRWKRKQHQKVLKYTS